jgi:excisionase family DNA binding protein
VSLERVAYSVMNAAAACDLSGRTLRRAIRAGELRAARIGSRLIVPRAELERFIADRIDPEGLPARPAPAHIVRKAEAARARERGAR